MKKVVWTMRWVASMLMVVGVLAIAQPAHAQQPPASSSSAAQEGFVPVDKLPPVQDTLPAPRLVAAAYGFVWVMLVLYVWSISARLTKVQRELDSVTRRVTSGGRPA